MDFNYNVVVVGKTGVGKSTLINYLYGEKVREARVGKPVTERGFHPIEIMVNDLPVTLYDSWGLEAGKDQEWMEELENELSQRGLDKSAKDWFHAVYYCISASGAKVEDYDQKIIKKFIDEKYKVTVIFTKSDAISVEDKEPLINSLEEFSSLPVIFVSSEKKERMDGTVTKTFGKEEIEKVTMNDLWDSLVLRLPARYEKIITTSINEFIASVKSEHIDNLSSAGLNKSKVHNSIYQDSRLFINKVLNKLTAEFMDELSETLKNYEVFARELNLKSKSFKFNISDFYIKPYNEQEEDFYETLKEMLKGDRKSNVKKQMEESLEKFRGRLTYEQNKRRKEIERILIQLKGDALS